MSQSQQSVHVYQMSIEQKVNKKFYGSAGSAHNKHQEVNDDFDYAHELFGHESFEEAIDIKPPKAKQRSL